MQDDMARSDNLRNMNLSQYPTWPHGGFAGWHARREERTVVIPPERRPTQQTARKATAHTGLKGEMRLTGVTGIGS